MSLRHNVKGVTVSAGVSLTGWLSMWTISVEVVSSSHGISPVGS